MTAIVRRLGVLVLVSASLLVGAPSQCTPTWSAAGAGVDDQVWPVQAMPDGSWFFGGVFSSAGPIASQGIARWDGSAWTGLAGGVSGGAGTTIVWSIAPLPSGDLVIGGQFALAGGVPAPALARWDGSSWSAVGPALTNSSGILSVQDIQVESSTSLLVAGRFDSAGGVAVANLARWDGSAWSAVGPPLFDSVTGFVRSDVGELFVVGSVGSARTVAKWDGMAWTTLGVAGGPTPALSCIEQMADGSIVVGGPFTDVNGVPAISVARWDGNSWSQVGDGLEQELVFGSSSFWIEAWVFDLEPLPNGDLMAAGLFHRSGATSLANVARWDGVQWNDVGGGANGIAQGLGVDADGVVGVGGTFDSVGGQTAIRAGFWQSCAARVERYGSGCPGSGGPNELAATSFPRVGAVYESRATGMPSFAFVFRALGFAQISTPLSLALPVAGPGCQLLTTPDVVEVLFPSAGEVVAQTPLPANAALLGTSLNEQVLPLAVDPSLVPIELTSTNGLLLVIGL